MQYIFGLSPVPAYRNWTKLKLGISLKIVSSQVSAADIHKINYHKLT